MRRASQVRRAIVCALQEMLAGNRLTGGSQTHYGIRLGRVSDVPENDRPFGCGAQDIARDWCERAGIPFLGAADIGHDAANKIVPFGLARTPARS